MENEYNIFDDLKGQVICMITRTFDDAEDFNAFLEIADLISQIEDKLEAAKGGEVYWKEKAFKYFRDNEDLKKKLEEVTKVIEGEES